MNRWRTALFLLLPALLGGCGFGGENSVPSVVVSKRFFSMDTNAKLLLDSPQYAWWQQFQSAELNELVADGFRCNPDVHIARANLDKARGELKQVKLSWIPMLGLYAGYSTNPALGIPGAFYGAWPYYALNIMKLSSEQKKMQHQVEYQRAEVDSVRLVLTGQIASAYFTLLAEKEQLRLLNTLALDVQELLMLTRKNKAIGLQNDIDIAELEVVKRQVEAQRQPVLHNIVVSGNALRFLTGRNPGAIKTSQAFSTMDFVRFHPGSLPATVLNHRPDVRMAIAAVKRDNADIAVALSQFFPVVQLDNFIGEAHLPESRFAELTDAYVHTSLAPSTFGLVQSKKGAYVASAAEYVKTVRRVLRDVDNDFSANKRISEQFQSTRKAEASYRRQYELKKGLYRTGIMSYKEVLGDKLYLDELALTTNQTKLQLAMSVAMLYQDLAGGYAVHG